MGDVEDSNTVTMNSENIPNSRRGIAAATLTSGTEAEIMDENRTKVLRVFLLAIQSHL